MITQLVVGFGVTKNVQKETLADSRTRWNVTLPVQQHLHSVSVWLCI